MAPYSYPLGPHWKSFANPDSLFAGVKKLLSREERPFLEGYKNLRVSSDYPQDTECGCFTLCCEDQDSGEPYKILLNGSGHLGRAFDISGKKFTFYSTIQFESKMEHPVDLLGVVNKISREKNIEIEILADKGKFEKYALSLKRTVKRNDIDGAVNDFIETGGSLILIHKYLRGEEQHLVESTVI